MLSSEKTYRNPPSSFPSTYCHFCKGVAISNGFIPVFASRGKRPASKNMRPNNRTRLSRLMIRYTK